MITSKKIALAGCLVVSIFAITKTQGQTNTFKADKNLLKVIDKDHKIAASQYKLLAKSLKPGQFPKTWHADTGKLETSDSRWWCSGFYPGTLLYLYHQTKDKALLAEANHIMGVLAKEQFNKTTHDLGFMMYCSFGNAQKFEPKPEYKQILINSARSLASRFDPRVGCIRSWDSKKPEYLVIIDNMMNLELLFGATRATGDSSFYKIAVTHANTTMKNHFRPNYSSYHVVVYDPETGQVKKKRTEQGYSDDSAWSRGQAWGLYGYTVMYRETRDAKYLDQADHIAHFILNNPNLPQDKIPYWDLNAPNIPGALRDASAAAVMASAFLELCGYTKAKAAAQLYFNTAQTIIRTLSAKPYFASVGTNGGFILQHSVGHMPHKTEIDVPLTYADYYFIEALDRYKTLTSRKIK